MLQPAPLGHPGRHLAPTPQPAILGRRREPLAQGLQVGRIQQRGGPPVLVAQVAQRLGPVRGIALQQLVDPARAQGRDLGHLAFAMALGEQPNDLEVALFHGVLCGPKARLEFAHAQKVWHHDRPPGSWRPG